MQASRTGHDTPGHVQAIWFIAAALSEVCLLPRFAWLLSLACELPDEWTIADICMLGVDRLGLPNTVIRVGDDRQ
jgi:hypothetical protein